MRSRRWRFRPGRAVAGEHSLPLSRGFLGPKRRGANAPPYCGATRPSPRVPSPRGRWPSRSARHHRTARPPSPRSFSGRVARRGRRGIAWTTADTLRVPSFLRPVPASAPSRPTCLSARDPAPASFFRRLLRHRSRSWFSVPAWASGVRFPEFAAVAIPIPSRGRQNVPTPNQRSRGSEWDLHFGVDTAFGAGERMGVIGTRRKEGHAGLQVSQAVRRQPGRLLGVGRDLQHPEVVRTIEDVLLAVARETAQEDRERAEAEKRQGIADAHRSIGAAHRAWAARFMPHTLREDYVAR